MNSKYLFREDWLDALVDCFREAFFVGDRVPELPKNVRVSCGFPKGRRNAIGQCWAAECSKDSSFEIFIHPGEAESLRVADILLHECIHAAVGIEAGHRGPFKRAATALGLEGPMKATVAGDALKARLAAMIAPLGKYPHAELIAAAGVKKEGTRMIKLECPGCGMVIRCAAKWLESPGAPTCACGEKFEAEGMETPPVALEKGKLDDVEGGTYETFRDTRFNRNFTIFRNAQGEEIGREYVPDGCEDDD